MKCVVCAKPLTGRQRLYCSPSHRVAACLRKKRAELKRRMVEYLGGACKRCGYSKCLRALSIHHADPDRKHEGRLNGTIAYEWRSWAAVTKELDSCQLLCANCHMETHCRFKRS